MIIRIGNIEPITDVEGPGKRFALWVAGCTFRCKGCCNPHLFSKTAGKDMTTSEIIKKLHSVKDEIEGISLLGGEPMEQASELVPIAKEAKKLGLSVMIYSGFLLKDIQKCPAKNELLCYADLLVDGQFEKDKRTTTKRWIGSSNQKLHFLSDFYSETDSRFSDSNEITFSYKNGELTVVGFPQWNIFNQSEGFE